MQNTDGKFAYGIHGPNNSDFVSSIIEDVMETGEDITYKEWENDIRRAIDGLIDEVGEEDEKGWSDEKDYPEVIARYLWASDLIGRPDMNHALVQQLDMDRLDDCFSEDEIFDRIMEEVGDSLYDGEPHTYVKEVSGGLTLQVSPLGGAQHLWVIKSPWVTACEGCSPCSPCIPGGGDLDNPVGWFEQSEVRPGYWPGQNQKWAYCLPPGDFAAEDQLCPYLSVKLASDYPDLTPTIGDVLNHPDVEQLFGRWIETLKGEAYECLS